MDAALISSNPRASVSALPLSSASFYSGFSALGRDFGGCEARVLSYALRCRRRCRKLKLRSRPPRLVVQASLDGRSILAAVAVVAANFAAVRLIYLNYASYQRRKKDSSQLSDLTKPDIPENPAVPENMRDVSQQGNIKNMVESLEDLNNEILQKKIAVEHDRVDCYENDSSANKERFNSFRSVTTGIVEATALTNSAIPSVGEKWTEDSADETSELFPESQGEVHLESDMPGINPGPALGSPAVPFRGKYGDSETDEAINHEVLQVSKQNRFSKFISEDLYTFFEEKQSVTGTRTTFEGISHNLKRKETSLAVDSEVDQKKQYSTRMKNYVEASRLSKRKRERHKSDYKRSPWLSLPNGTHAKDKSETSQFLTTYHRLLRDERLLECLELLENKEREGLLDMDKVYHARFFNTCKSRKAVKAAFRFAKLIKNPTLSTFNMLLSVCAHSQDFEGAFQVLLLVKEAGLKADCKLYTTLISTCAKTGKVDVMFEVFHEMVNGGVEPNVHTYGALIDGCARAGQVAKAFGAYGILRSKKVKPDRVIFNALITACGQSGAVDRAFDVLAEMRAEPTPIDPDHVTVGALMKTCMQAGQVDQAREVYKMIKEFDIKGTAEVYTIAVNICSEEGDLEFALSVYTDMKQNGVAPDEMFLSALIDVAGHAGRVETAFEILQSARLQGLQLGNVSYSSLMGACSNSKNWQKAIQLYQDIKDMKLRPTVSTVNALITSLCEGDQVQKAMEILDEVKEAGLMPNAITYSVLLGACEKKDDLELGLKLFSEARKAEIAPCLVMCKYLIGMCLQRYERAYFLGQPNLSSSLGKLLLNNKWTTSALMVYREAIVGGVVPSMEIFSRVLGCLRLPHDASFRNRLIENLGFSSKASKQPNISSLLDGFGEFDPRAFSLLEEAASLGIVPGVSFKESPILFDARKLQHDIAQVYVLTILKGLRHRFAAGSKLPSLVILLHVERTALLSPKGNKTVALAGRVGQAVTAMLRRLGLSHQGKESVGRIRISATALRRWFQPKLSSPSNGKPAQSALLGTNLAKRITDQQRDIRNSNLSIG